MPLLLLLLLLAVVTVVSCRILDFILKAVGSHWNVFRGEGNDYICVLNDHFGCNMETDLGSMVGGRPQNCKKVFMLVLLRNDGLVEGMNRVRSH